MNNHQKGAKASYIALIVFILIWMWGASGLHRFTKETFAEFQAPALQIVSKGSDLARYWELKSRSNEELISASRDLARINAALELRIHSMDDIRRENTRLRENARYSSNSEFLTVVARVISRDSSSWWQKIIIRKGRNDGIRPGSPVVFSDRVIGRVSAVHLNISEVDLVTSPSFRCTAFLIGDEKRRIVYVRGDAANSLSPNKAKVTAIPIDYNPPTGQPIKVLTTGLGGVFPSGLILGEVDGAIRMSTDDNYKVADLNPAKDLNMIEEVSVLVPQYPTANEILLAPSEKIKLEEFK
jgi:rod shape-determining protein MreC